MNRKLNPLKLVLLSVFVTLFLGSNAQELYKGFPAEARAAKGIRIAFYNVENLFDTSDDSLKNDAEFLPEGTKHWTDYKYWEKLKKTAKTISALGGWEAPAIVSLAEVENRHTLINLVHHTSLETHKYNFIHFESPDKRGIDVAMLYRYEKVDVLESRAIPVHFPATLGGRPTRDILYAKISVLGRDTLHVFVNHWPSRWGGQMQTEPKRMHAAEVLKSVADSILQVDPQAAIVMMGDLNDTPADKSLTQVLKAQSDTSSHGSYYNLAAYKNAEGTHYYDGRWSVLDQIIVSKGLLHQQAGFVIRPFQMQIFKAPFLLEENSFGHQVPNRSYHGMKYHGGFSDHLPVFVDVYLKTQ